MKVKIEDQIIDMETTTFIQLLKKGKIPPWSLIRSRIFTEGNWRRLEDLNIFKILAEDLTYKEKEKSIDEIINSLELERSDLSSEIRFLSYQRKFPTLTLFLVAINVGIFLIQTIAGGSENLELLIKFGAYAYPLIVHNNEYWRLVSHTFLHIGVWHLLVNMGVLYFLGATLEGLYGKSRFLILYFLSGLAGGIASLLFVKGPIGAGASGAIFGLIGVMVTFGIQYRNEIPSRRKRGFGLRLVPFIIADLVLGFVIPGINMAAHIGGLIGGFVFAWFLSPAAFRKGSKKESSFVKTFAVTVAGIMLLCEVMVAINLKTNETENVNIVTRHQAEIIDKRTQRILNEYEEALDKPYNENSYKMLEMFYMAMRKEVPEDKKEKWNKKLEKLYSKAISEDPQNPDWHNNFAWLYVEMNVKPNKAISLALKALRFSSDRPAYILDTLAWAYLRTNQYKKALDTFEMVFESNPEDKQNSWDSSLKGLLEIARSDVRRDVFIDFYNRMKIKTTDKPELKDKLEAVFNEFQKYHKT